MIDHRRAALFAASALGLAAPASAAHFVVRYELDLKPEMVVDFSGQRLRQTLEFAPTILRQGDTFEFHVDFKPGQSLVMTDDTRYSAVRPEIITLDFEFADRRQRTITYTMDVRGVTGDYDGSYETQTLATRSTGPNLSNASPFDLTGSSFGFTGVSWFGRLGSDRVDTPLSPVVFEVVADNLRVVTQPVAPVPEPSGWAMMIAGFGLSGGALRRASRLPLPGRALKA